MHFLNAYDLPTSKIFDPLQSQSLDGFGGTLFIQFDPIEELIGINFNGEDAVNWSAYVIEHKYIPPSVNESITLNSVYEGSIEVITENCQYIVLTPILLSDDYRKYFTYNASMIDARKVIFTNVIGTSNAYGNLKLDNTENIPSGEFKWLRFNTTPHNIKTLNERFINSNIYKHNNWNGDVTKFFLNKNFTVQELNNNHDANFIQLYPATIKNVIDGISFNDQLPVWFNDPWYVKDQFDNQSGMGDFISPPSPYYPTGKYNESSGGVFLNLSGPPLWNPPYYSVKVPQAVQNLYLPQTGRYHNFYFMGWTGTEVQFQNSNALQTGVVFKDNIQGVDPVVKANLKGQLMSDDQNGISSASQRKIVRTDNGRYHVVYESMGTVWYAHSATSDFYGAWYPDQLMLEKGKNPAIEYDGNVVKVVCEEYNPQYGGNANIWVLTFEQSMQGGWYENTDAEIIASYPNSYYGNAKPVISYYNGLE